MVRKRVVFRGHVQGVGLRGTLSKQCLRRHVTGWMSNAPDLSMVLAELQGDMRSIDTVLRSVASYFSDSTRSRGMSVSISGEVDPSDADAEMHEVQWSDVGETF